MPSLESDMTGAAPETEPADDLAVFSLGLGGAASVFACFGFTSWPHLLALPLGLAALLLSMRSGRIASVERRSAARYARILSILALALWAEITFIHELSVAFGP